ncbi:SgcJ/EcaC family oxidoreductase [Nocardia wallacei]|uniref:SgcJ/EcaC family oxidoreductase n=1 Tax=Nocardia wallacei TaxID=480035 RepID=UPI0024573EC0|nr:SgcJ/EcaC family oxidoreductase [Nocardia wallacei]
MRKTVYLAVALAALTSAAVTACSGDGSGSGGADAGDEAALADLKQRQWHAWERADGRGFAATFTEDADFVAVTGEHIHGRRAIAESMQQGFDTFMAGTRVRPAQDRRVRFLSPDLAIVISSGVCVLRPGATECRPQDLSIQTRTAIKRDGHWLFTAFHNGRISPPPA